MEKSFKAIVDASNSILVLLQKNPSFDQVAAALSLYLSLEGKKEIIISCPTPMKVEYNRLVGVDKISEEVGNKNLVIRFSDYPAENIEKVSYDVENQEFRLSVIPKTTALPPKKDQVMISYSGVSADTTFLVGGVAPADFPALSADELNETKLIHIGTNDIDVPEGKKIISLSRPAGALCELVAEYIKEIEGGYHPDIASNLLSGLYEGSENFSGKNVGVNTFKLAGELVQSGGKYTRNEEFKGVRPNYPFPGMPQMPVPFPPKAQKGAFMVDDKSPEEDSVEVPEGEYVQNPPPSWLKPKIYKGTSVS